MADFVGLAAPYLRTHSTGVAALAAAAARRCRLPAGDVTAVRHAGLVHDLGRVAVPAPVWQRPGALTPDDWERVRLHPYQTERVLTRSPYLAGLARIASCHHERLDGSGYHRGTGAAGLPRVARILAAADAYHAMREPRPHREPLPPDHAARVLREEAAAGRLDAQAVAAVLACQGQPARRPDARGRRLTEREIEVLRLLATGHATKQISRVLGISPKTADNHIQAIYAKAGVSTRAGATLFAMQQGLLSESALWP